MSKNKLIFSLILVFLSLILSFNTIGAQTAVSEVAISISAQDPATKNGQIICSDANGYSLCQKEYDSSIYGVVDDNPGVAIEVTSTQNLHLVVSKGEIAVGVSTTNGNIKKGDYLTTSKIAGVAELSTNNGYVIGTALEDFSSADKAQVGQIKVALNIHPRTDVVNPKENLLDLFRSGLAGLGVSPIAALRYVLASAMVLISFGIGLIYFGRIAKTGVEAIGRNPLAGLRIQVSVLINIAIMVAIVFVGLTIAYFILAL